MPLSSVSELSVMVDGESIPDSSVWVAVDDRRIRAGELVSESGWWFIQDRLVIEAEHPLHSGTHSVQVGFRLLVPYLQSGPADPLVLPMHIEGNLDLDSVSRVLDPTRKPHLSAPATFAGARLPEGWILSASSFNWTPDVCLASVPAIDVVTGIVAEGVAATIELEAGQVWRSFPAPDRSEIDALRDGLAEAGGRVSIVGMSLDDFTSTSTRKSEAERMEFLLPQLRAAARVGASGVRLPIGQAGLVLLARLQPVLHELGLTLFEEIQGQQRPDDPVIATALETIAELGDERVRVLVDVSMLMPSLPPTYLERLRAGGVPGDLVDRLQVAWREPETHDAVIALLRSGRVPPAVHTMYMNLLIRFGRSDASDLSGILPLVGGFHLKFWDLDDSERRISQPLRDLGRILARHDWKGTLTSEWGGHEWLEKADATDMTRRHLTLARAALADGASS